MKRTLTITITLCLLFLLGLPYANAQVVNKYGHLQVIGTQLCDQQGNPIQLKGMSSFWLNWDNAEGIGYANYDAIKWLRDNWNMQLFRASMGVEAGGGYFSNPEGTLEKMHHIVQSCIDLGIYVIIDYHTHNAERNPQIAKEFFGLMASTYGHYPNVLYEPFNEPVAQDWSTVIKPYHRMILDTIRVHSPNGIVLFGVRNWSQYVDEAASDPVVDPGEDPQTMLVLHFYGGTHGQAYRTRAETAMDRGQALFVTEWGASNADGGEDMLIYPEETGRWLDWMKEKKISWAAWNLHDKEESCAILAAGAPVSGGWDSDDYFKGHAFLVREAMLKDPETCLFHVNPTQLNINFFGGEFPISITTESDWTATLQGEWLTASHLNASGNDTITLSVLENNLDSIRTASITVTLTCPDEELSYDIQVSIQQLPYYTVESVTLNTNNLLLSLHDNTTLTASVSPSNATVSDVTWQSLDTTVASVNEQGEILAKGLGTTTIVVTTVDGNHTDSCHIEVITCAYSINLALGKSARASSREEVQYDARYANDGLTSTRWASGQSDSEWLRIDLGNTYYIDQVNLLWEAAYGKDYRIDISPDNETWYMAHRTTDGSGGAEVLSNIGGYGRYIRMSGLKRGSAWGYSLWEMGVFGCLTMEEGKNYLMASSGDYRIDSSAYSGAIEILSTVVWSASKDADWLTISFDEGSTDGSITINAQENTTFERRIAAVTITSEEFERVVYIHQGGRIEPQPDPDPDPDPNSASIDTFNSLKVFPIPATTHLDVQFELNEPSKARIEVFNTLGQRIQSIQVGQLEAGQHVQRIPLLSIQPGVCILKLTIENGKGAYSIPYRFLVGK